MKKLSILVCMILLGTILVNINYFDVGETTLSYSDGPEGHYRIEKGVNGFDYVIYGHIDMYGNVIENNKFDKLDDIIINLDASLFNSVNISLELYPNSEFCGPDLYVSWYSGNSWYNVDSITFDYGDGPYSKYQTYWVNFSADENPSLFGNKCYNSKLKIYNNCRTNNGISVRNILIYIGGSLSGSRCLMASGPYRFSLSCTKGLTPIHYNAKLISNFYYFKSLANISYVVDRMNDSYFYFVNAHGGHLFFYDETNDFYKYYNSYVNSVDYFIGYFNSVFWNDKNIMENRLPFRYVALDGCSTIGHWTSGLNENKASAYIKGDINNCYILGTTKTLSVQEPGPSSFSIINYLLNDDLHTMGEITDYCASLLEGCALGYGNEDLTFNDITNFDSTPYLYDVNLDTCIDSLDLQYVNKYKNEGLTGTAGWIRADIDRDGDVDNVDYNILNNYIGGTAIVESDLEVENIDVIEGKTGISYVTITDVENLQSGSINLSWDSSVVELTGVSSPNFYCSNPTIFTNYAIINFQGTPKSGDLSLLQLTFSAVGSYPDYCRINITTYDFSYSSTSTLSHVYNVDNGIASILNGPSYNAIFDYEPDDDIDFWDFVQFAEIYNTSVTPGSFGDYDEDGDIDFFDFDQFAQSYGATN